MSYLIFGEVMKTTNSGEVVLDGTASERLSKLIEWAAQFVNSIHTSAGGREVCPGLESAHGYSAPTCGKYLLSGPSESDRNPNHL